MAPVSGQEAGSNLGPVSQASEGQGSAIQPQRSQQEEESALSAAEEVAGPAQGRGYLRRPATAKALLRPTASLVSTAQVQQRQSSPPQPQSPKTHSVVSQSIPALQVAPTPGSVHGQQLGWGSLVVPAENGPASTGLGAAGNQVVQNSTLGQGVPDYQAQWHQDFILLQQTLSQNGAPPHPVKPSDSQPNTAAAHAAVAAASNPVPGELVGEVAGAGEQHAPAHPPLQPATSTAVGNGAAGPSQPLPAVLAGITAALDAPGQSGTNGAAGMHFAVPGFHQNCSKRSAAGTASRPPADAAAAPPADTDQCAASEAVPVVASALHSKRSMRSASGSDSDNASGSGSGRGPGMVGGGADANEGTSHRPREDSAGMPAPEVAEPAVAVIVGEGPMTEGAEASVTDAEAGPVRQEGSAAEGTGPGHNAGDSKYAGSPSRPQPDATAGHEGATSAAAAVAGMMVLGLGNGGVPVHLGHVEGASSQGTWQQDSGDGPDAMDVGAAGEGEQGEMVGPLAAAPDAGHALGSELGEGLGTTDYNAIHPATSVHAMVINTEAPEPEVAPEAEAEAAWQPQSAGSHPAAEGAGPPQRSVSPSHHTHGAPPAEAGASRQGSPTARAYESKGAPQKSEGVPEGPLGPVLGQASSIAMAVAGGQSTRSASISGGAGGPNRRSRSNTVEASWRADSQMAEASQSSSGDTAVSRGAEAGDAQLSNERASSIERASRSHIEDQGAASGPALGPQGEAGSEMGEDVAGPQHALDVGSPMAGSAAGGSTLLAGPGTPTAAEPGPMPVDAAGAALSTAGASVAQLSALEGLIFAGPSGLPAAPLPFASPAVGDNTGLPRHSANRQQGAQDTHAAGSGRPPQVPVRTASNVVTWPGLPRNAESNPECGSADTAPGPAQAAAAVPHPSHSVAAAPTAQHRPEGTSRGGEAGGARRGGSAGPAGGQMRGVSVSAGNEVAQPAAAQASGAQHPAGEPGAGHGPEDGSGSSMNDSRRSPKRQRRESP